MEGTKMLEYPFIIDTELSINNSVEDIKKYLIEQHAKQYYNLIYKKSLYSGQAVNENIIKACYKLKKLKNRLDEMDDDQIKKAYKRITKRIQKNDFIVTLD